MQQLEVRRLTRSESNRERARVDPHHVGVPDQAPIKWIVQAIGKTDRTIARYRQLLIANCLEYQTIAVMNGIDNPVLVKRQIELLTEFSELMTAYKNVAIAIDIYNREHVNPMSL